MTTGIAIIMRMLLNLRFYVRLYDDQPPVFAAHEADLFRPAQLFDNGKNLTPRMVRIDPGQILDPDGT